MLPAPCGWGWAEGMPASLQKSCWVHSFLAVLPLLILLWRWSSLEKSTDPQDGDSSLIF